MKQKSYLKPGLSFKKKNMFPISGTYKSVGTWTGPLWSYVPLRFYVAGACQKLETYSST